MNKLIKVFSALLVAVSISVSGVKTTAKVTYGDSTKIETQVIFTCMVEIDKYSEDMNLYAYIWLGEENYYVIKTPYQIPIMILTSDILRQLMMVHSEMSGIQTKLKDQKYYDNWKIDSIRIESEYK